MPDPSASPPVVRAAAYVRMSTDHQQYSTNNQMDVIQEYAVQRGMEIVHVYSDEGKSGLKIQGRNQLVQMIQDVENRRSDFSCILVYDVSRWGRFQDADESAYYEYICRRANISIHYCAEQFENDGSPVSTIVKGVKRAMAGEYSRELSSKVFQGACRLIQLGYKQGGAAGYGLRRMLVDERGNHKGILEIRQQKSIQTDRVILVAGPEEEVRNVRRMYDAFLRGGKIESEIASELNSHGVLTDLGRAWTRGTVHEVLTNEKYIGNNVYHRTSFKLKRKHVQNPKDKWIRAENVFESIVDIRTFAAVQEIILTRSHKLTDVEMLDGLRSVLKQHGRISGLLIDEHGDMPSSSAFRHRFGSLVTAYQLIGYDPGVDYTFIEINRELRRQYAGIFADTILHLEEIGATVFKDPLTDLLNVNGELRVSIVLCRHFSTEAGFSRWIVRLDDSLRPDITIAIRMNAANTGPRDYYLLPGIDMTWEALRITEDNGVYLDGYRFDTLEYFFGMAKRCCIEEVA